MGENEKIIKAAASRVNMTLNWFEKDYIAVKRCPENEQEVCKTMEEYVERRFNMEAYKIPELHEAVKLTQGHLFYVDELEKADPVKRRFKLAHIKIITEELIETNDQTLKDEIAKAKEFIGGSHIIFNSVKQKIKLVIKDV